MLSAPLGPEVEEEKAMENVERLPRVSEAAGMIGEEPERVALSLGGSVATLLWVKSQS